MLLVATIILAILKHNGTVHCSWLMVSLPAIIQAAYIPLHLRFFGFPLSVGPRLPAGGGGPEQDS